MRWRNTTELCVLLLACETPLAKVASVLSYQSPLEPHSRNEDSKQDTGEEMWPLAISPEHICTAEDQHLGTVKHQAM